MQIFINELSLEGQYFSDADFSKAVRVFVAIFSEINEKVKEKQTYKDSRLFIDYKVIRDKNFLASSEKIRDRSLKDAFRNIIFNKLNPKDWRTEQKHSWDDDFWYVAGDNREPVTDTTLAEAAERMLQDSQLLCLLVNFINSRFKGKHKLPVLKNSDEDNLINLDCVEDELSLETWLEDKLDLSRYEYDNKSRTPPTDDQTVLRDAVRFKPTSLTPQGRRAYREVKTGYYWYVDNFHFGGSAQLEVFNPRGKHIGEADLEGNIDVSKKDRSKRLDI